MSAIVTFYSYKGGVGRTMALANIAVLLMRQGLRVLAVDWDLEAPGLDKYFLDFEIRSQNNGAGLLDLLNDSVQASISGGQQPDWQQYVSKIDLQTNDSESEGVTQPSLTLMTSGRQDKGYFQRVLDFNWNVFFEDHNGGDFIESLREDWLDRFDIVLVDSRTGITDPGGVCTIQIPDILVLFVTANEQSLLGAKDVALRAQAGRQKLDYDRMPLSILPLPSRYDGRTEYSEGRAWMTRFAEELSLFYQDWLPKDIKPSVILEKTKLPYVAFFSFGEKLPVMIENISDPESLSHAYDVVAGLIGSEFQDIQLFIDPIDLGVIDIQIPMRETEAMELSGSNLFAATN